jgi:hypothetical protein
MSRRWALCFLGRLRELANEVRREVEIARERGDLYGVMTCCSGFPNVVWLLEDDVEGARREASEAIGRWSQSGFHLQHLFDLYAQTNIDLYEAKGRQAYERISAAWPTMQRAGLLKVEVNRGLMHELRARAALAAARDDGAQRATRVSVARRDAEQLRRVERGWTRGSAAFVEAQAGLLDNPRDARARRLLEDALSAFVEGDMAMHAAVARVGLASLKGERQAALEDAGCWFRTEGVKQPERMIAMLAPGLAV